MSGKPGAMSDDETPASSAVVPGYAGHGDTLARRLSDQQVRAWTGELLVDLQDRLPVDAVRARLDALLLRCEFGDQHLIRAIEDNRYAGDGFASALEAADRTLVETANQARTVNADGLPAFIAALERAFDERAAAAVARLEG
jgi:hypothetical protein